MTHNRIVRLSAILLLFVYTVPWIVHTTETLTLNAYDLAEWTTLHPNSRSSTLPLLESFLLRIQLVLILWLLISTTVRSRFFSVFGLIKLAVIILISISLLPPIDQLTNISDPNYRQQLFMTALALIGSLIIDFSPLGWRWAIQVILLALGLMGGLIGIFQAGLLLQSYGLSISIGFGAIAYIVIIIISIVLLAITKKG